MTEHHDYDDEVELEWGLPGARIRSLAKLKGWSLSDLAERVGVGRSEVTRVTKDANIKDATLQKYADALGVTVVFLKHGQMQTEDAAVVYTAAHEAGRQEGLNQAKRSIARALKRLTDIRVARATDAGVAPNPRRGISPDVEAEDGQRGA